MTTGGSSQRRSGAAAGVMGRRCFITLRTKDQEACSGSDMEAVSIPHHVADWDKTLKTRPVLEPGVEWAGQIAEIRAQSLPECKQKHRTWVPCVHPSPRALPSSHISAGD